MQNPVTVRFLDRTTPPHILTLVLVAGLSAMNMSVFLPSLPRMTEYFGTDYGVMQLAVSLYLAITAILQVFIGPISDRFGRRSVILGSIAVFILATVGCLFAPSVEIFLVFRMVQGVVVAGMVLSRATVRDMVPEEQSASMIGYVTMGMSLVPMFAPVIGGSLDALLGWQATFVFLIFFGVLVFSLVWADQGETLVRSNLSFAEQVRSYPELLRARRFWGYVFAAAFSSGAFFAFLGGAPYVASAIYQISPSVTGILFGLPAVGYALGNFLTGRYVTRVGINRLIWIGALITTSAMASSLVLTYAGFAHPAVFFGLCTFVGLGNGLVLPNSTAGMLSVRPKLAGTASGLGGAIMIGAGAMMSAVAGAVLQGSAGPQPLQWIMFATSAMSALCVAYVARRERVLATA